MWPPTNGYQLYVADFADSNTYKVGFSLEGISATVELLTPEQVRADEAALGVDVNHRTDTPVTEGWTAMIQTQALREQLEQNTASGNKLELCAGCGTGRDRSAQHCARAGCGRCAGERSAGHCGTW